MDLTINITEGVVIRPGDTVLVTLPQDTTPDEAAQIRRQWDDRASGIKALFLAGAESVLIQRQGHAVSRVREHLANACECGARWEALDVMECPRTARTA